jgi:hypothetical protein
MVQAYKDSITIPEIKEAIVNPQDFKIAYKTPEIIVEAAM